MLYKNFHEAYPHILDQLYHNPQFYNTARGLRSREQINTHFILIDPRQRVCYFPARKTNIIFNFAEVLWYLAGRNDLDYLSYYAKSVAKYSMDNQTLTGTAYGPKLFHFGTAQVNQWHSVIELLSQQDRDSRRATIQIFDANEWLVENNIDVSCTLALQFFVRENKLYMTSYMRSNDAYRGMISDIFSFTFMQEFMARQLGLELGHYCHNVGSLHIYDEDENRVIYLLEEARPFTTMFKTPFDFPEMPHDRDNWQRLDLLLKYEQALRKNVCFLELQHVREADLPLFWQQILLLFGIYRGIVYEYILDLTLYEQLLPIYQFFVKNRWSHLELSTLQSRL